MSSIELSVNGKSVRTTVDPRESIGAFVRDELNLTATHLACEHGVCGACTILIDGAHVRGCITFAATVDGQKVQTLEDFEDEPLMNLIRSCFSEAHGLQFGFCRSEEHTSELQSLMRISYDVFCLKKKNT